MTAFTPGPWSWWTSCSFNRLSSDATGKDGDVLRAVVYSDGHPGIEGTPADMALIAAAPDLYAEMELVRVRLLGELNIPQSFESWGRTNSNLDRIEALLKRARGEG